MGSGILTVQERQQVLLLQRELACQLPIGVGSLGRGGASSASNKMTA